MSEHQEYVRRIVLAINCIERTYTIKSKWMGIKANTLYLLYALNDGKKHTQKDIADEWLIPRTTLNTIIKECEADGYIKLEPIPKTKRELHIRLTSTGKKFAQKILDPIYQAEEQAMLKTLKSCNPDFIKDLEKFCQNLKIAFTEVK